MTRRSLALALVLFTALPAFAQAQAPATNAQAPQRSRVNGIVKAEHGTPMAGALVQLRNVKTGVVVATLRTDAGGHYAFELAESGLFVLELVSASAGKIVVVTHSFAMSPGKPVDVDIDGTSAPQIVDLEIGNKVWVVNAKGLEQGGEVTSLSSSFIELATTAGVSRIAMSDVATISKKDSNKQGFLIGAAFGCVAEVGFASWLERVASSLDRKPEHFGAGQRIAFCVAGGLAFGGIGAFIDGRIEGREVVYRHAEPRTIVRLTPIIEIAGPKRAGVGGTISWR